MVQFTRLNDTYFFVNPELIETVEETPDTVVTLTTGRKFVVRETAAQIQQMIVEYKRKIFVQGPSINSSGSVQE